MTSKRLHEWDHDKWDYADSRPLLETFGFRVLRDADILCYEVQPPAGWTKAGNYSWIYVTDDKGRCRFDYVIDRPEGVAFVHPRG